MKSDRVPVMVNREPYERIKEYAIATGVSITKVIEEALTDWSNTVATVRLEAIKSKTIEAGPMTEVIEMPHIDLPQKRLCLCSANSGPCLNCISDAAIKTVDAHN